MVLLNIDAIESTDDLDFAPLPDGWYAASISESAIRTGKDSGKDYLNLEFTVTAGDYTSRKVWMVYSLWHDNPDVVRWAKEKLGKLAGALNMASIEDHEELTGQQVESKVALDRNNRNEVKYYRSAGDTPPPSSNGKAAPAWA